MTTKETKLEKKIHECNALEYDRGFNRYVCYLNGHPCPFHNPQACFRYLEMRRSEVRGAGVK